MKLIDLTGQRFSRLMVIERLGMTSDRKRVTWLCRCDCGAELVVQGPNLRSGNSKSCGCFNREVVAERARIRNTTHGHTSRAGISPEYSSWRAMLNRCKHACVKDSKYYLGRGIKVCKRWQKFENFLVDMGPKPTPKHSIDRINGNKHYTPSNCRWATPKEQSANRRIA